MSTYVFATESEIISGNSTDRFKAAAGLGEGFNPHAGTGTIASAKEQMEMRKRGETAFVQDLTSTTSEETAAIRDGIVLAIVDQALAIAGFDATWTVVAKNGVRVQVVPTDASATLGELGSETLAVALTTSLDDADVANAREQVLATIGTGLRTLDTGSSAYAGFGKGVAGLLAASRVVAIAIGKQHSALSELVDVASQAIARAAAVTNESVWHLDAADLAHCPVCSADTARTDVVCPNGHVTSAAVRAAQEIDVLGLMHTAAANASLTCVATGKVKGAGRITLDPSALDATTWASVQDVRIELTADMVDPWVALAATTSVRTELEAGVFARTGMTSTKSRVFNAAIDAIEKAANNAADDIAAPVATEIAHFVVATERARAAEAWQKIEAAHRADILRRSSAAPRNVVEKFVKDTNENRRFVNPNPNRSNKRRPAKRTGKAAATRRDANGRRRAR